MAKRQILLFFTDFSSWRRAVIGQENANGGVLTYIWKEFLRKLGKFGMSQV